MTWDEFYIGLSEYVSQKSKDPSTKVGAVICDRQHRPISFGFNGFPQAVKDMEHRLNDRDTKLMLTIHAEMNALLFAKGSVVGASCYVWPMLPCANCASMLIQAGIYRVVAPAVSGERRLRWGSHIDFAKEIFHEAGVEVVEV